MAVLTLAFGFTQSCNAQSPHGDSCSVANAACPYVAGLLSQREGYGAATTGGLNGPVVVVTSTDDSGPGSLRDVVESARGPVWIRFDRDMTIPLKSEIRVRGNLTIDGRGHMVTLTDYGFLIHRANNVILTHLTIDGRSETLGQAVTIDTQSDDMWLDHLDLSRFNDRLVDVKKGSTAVTLSWNKFHDDNKVMLLNNVINGPENPKNLFLYYDRDANSQVTLHHNYFVNTVQRNPRAIIGTYHLFNNVLENWDFYGMSFSLEAKVLLEGNVFDNRSSRSCVEPPFYATIERTERNYCHGIPAAGPRAVIPNGQADQAAYDASNPVYHYTHDAKAFMTVRGNIALHDAQLDVANYHSERVPKPPYCYSYQIADAALDDEVRKEAGNTSYDTTLALTRCP